ncbi:pyruvate kinase [Rivularia sp. PCC 7116]|uniref:pyruvate kinase n=1 Tax=Rivularia sp. PCC 7116 TaxID=373994 RepID=UPI00029F1470|nr:pyruvate kinase [Rivularia sp. PCC 7116]AFY55523.1 pyruvate kinase [Rivularia sp. PCC 7116]
MLSAQNHCVENQSRDLDDPQVLLATLQEIRQSVYEKGQEIFSQWEPYIQRYSFIKSAENLAYYLALRHHDLRTLQAALTPWGLSSLGRIEARVLPNLDAVIATLGNICQVEPDSLPNRPSIHSFLEGDYLLKNNTEDVLGKIYNQRWVRIMATLPTNSCVNYKDVKELLRKGTNCVRINCARDSVETWEAIISHVRRAEAQTGQRCKIMMELAGAKPRIKRIVAPYGYKHIFPGDCLFLRRELAEFESQNDSNLLRRRCWQATITIPSIIDKLEIGANVWIDDGRIGGYVECLMPEGVVIKITHAKDKGEKISADKGLNFPDTSFKLSPLTDKDKQDLDFIVTHADIVAYSFVQEVADVELLQQELNARQRKPSHREIALVAKIETSQAIKNLPELIVRAAGKQPFGVMIARGDLAVEIGYQRLVEMQEEILWLCEAAHIPVIWATQVLEQFVKKATPSRAEMTDAAMAERAECVMLNKGRYQIRAVTILDDVLKRMQEHQSKKTSQLRALHSWTFDGIIPHS